VSTRTDVLLWAQRILALSSAPPHQLLELQIDASIEAAQDAFHKIARSSHPDIHRSGLTPEELESVTLAYARCAGAYQDFRSQRMQTTRMRPMRDMPPTPTPGAPPAKPAAPTPTASKPAGSPVPSASQVTSGAGSSGQMNGKALIYYRKAELALRRGDLKGAMMQVKMAIAGDPQSTFLRGALVEIEAELAKKP
jgi:hypothetical protein